MTSKFYDEQMREMQMLAAAERTGELILPNEIARMLLRGRELQIHLGLYSKKASKVNE